MSAVVAVLVAALLGGVMAPAPARAQITRQARAVPSERGWNDDVAEAMAGSHPYLERRADRGGGRLAINLDIDNTALASYYDTGHATKRVLRFARRARSLDMGVLFNTARSVDDVERTAGVLRRAGYRVDAICGRRDGEGVVHSKKRCRARFRDAGWTLVANVGNSRTDFKGGGYERAYRLPNYDGRLS